jgi:hypothetical protein
MVKPGGLAGLILDLRKSDRRNVNTNRLVRLENLYSAGSGFDN